jgi:hypothetical protein
MTDYPAVLRAMWPDAEWSLTGDDYAGLTWLDDSPKPTKKMLDDAWPQVSFELEYAEVKSARQFAYQQTADPLFFKWQAGSATKEEWEAERQAIQDAHPYPEAV